MSQVTAELKKSLDMLMADSYWYSFYVDDLPTWAFLGERSTLIAPDAVFPGVPQVWVHMIENTSTIGCISINGTP